MINLPQSVEIDGFQLTIQTPEEARINPRHVPFWGLTVKCAQKPEKTPVALRYSQAELESGVFIGSLRNYMSADWIDLHGEEVKTRIGQLVRGETTAPVAAKKEKKSAS